MNSRDAAKFIAESAMQNVMDEWGSLLELLDSYFGDDFENLSAEEQETFAGEVLDDLDWIKQRILHEC